jgi:hypothetical protein
MARYSGMELIIINNNLQAILKSFDDANIVVEMGYSNENWYSSIPSLPGWYVIKTNTPVDILSKVGNPEGGAHINIPKTLSEIKKVLHQELVIKQKNNEVYVVYNGRAKNLKARAREHYKGHEKTYCLSLKQYETIKDYKWYFCYYPILKLRLNDINNKMFLIIVEQAWRTENGWPILCKQ